MKPADTRFGSGCRNKGSKRSNHDHLYRIQRPLPGLIIHFDGGGQCLDLGFRKMIAEHQCQQSMTRVNNYYNNAFAESLFSRCKAELLKNSTFQNIQQAQEIVFEYIEAYYSRKRRHSALNYKSPINLNCRFPRPINQN